MVRKGEVHLTWMCTPAAGHVQNRWKKHIITVSSPVGWGGWRAALLNISIYVLRSSMWTRTGINTFIYGCKNGRDAFHRCHCSFFIKRLIELHIKIQILESICLKANTEESTPKHSRNLASFPILKIVTQMHFFCCIQNAQYTQERRHAPVKHTLTYDV